MRKFTVTISGVDESVKILGLRELRREFDFVEWGVLYSLKNAGRKMRYPSRAWIRTLVDVAASDSVPMSVAVHLCGEISSLARHPLVDIDNILTDLTPKHGYGTIDRIQLNGWEYNDCLLRYPNRPILQIRSLENIERLLELRQNVDVLFDPSGGRGLEDVANWPSADFCRQLLATNVRRVGFAGGIGPGNVRSILEKGLALDVLDNPWIDMESGVRKFRMVASSEPFGLGLKIDEGLDLEAVHEVLSIAADVMRSS